MIWLLVSMFVVLALVIYNIIWGYDDYELRKIERRRNRK